MDVLNKMEIPFGERFVCRHCQGPLRQWPAELVAEFVCRDKDCTEKDESGKRKRIVNDDLNLLLCLECNSKTCFACAERQARPKEEKQAVDCEVVLPISYGTGLPVQAIV